MSSSTPWTVLNSSQRLADPIASPEQNEINGLFIGQFIEDSNTLNTRLQITPNPNSGTFTIAGAEMERVQIMEASGKLVRQLQGPFGQASEVSGLGPGLYLVRAQMVDGSVKSAKVVLN